MDNSQPFPRASSPDVHAPARGTRVRRTVLWDRLWRPLLESAAIYAFLTLSAHLGVATGNDGERFDLTPRGLGLVIDAFVLVVYVTVIHQFMILTASMVRPILGRALRGLMYVVLVLVIALVQWQAFVAVRLTPDQVILLRHYPQDPLTVDRSALEPPEITDAGKSRTMTIQLRTGGWCQSLSVYRVDPTTSATFDRLTKELGTRPKTPVAP